jgi:hypothetical protein
MNPPEAPAHPETAPRRLAWERWAVALVLLLFAVVGFNHILTNGFRGQDFLLHSRSTEELIADPSRWFPQDFTNRPLVYWIGAGAHRFGPGALPWETAAAIFVGLNTLALGLLHDSTRRFIRSPALRVAAVTFVAFLPATQVASVVYAADAVCQLPFVLATWSLLRALEASSTRARLGYAITGGLAFCLGDFARFTFIGLLPAAAVVLALAWRWQRISGRQALAMGGLALVVPVLLAGWIQVRAHRQFAGQVPHHTFDWQGTGEMTWSSLLLPKRTDARIFAAPIYWESETIEGTPRYSLLVNNSYSYPALLHLSIFTDVLDYANDGDFDDGTPRREPQQALAVWSVHLGLIFSISASLAVAWFFVRCTIAVWRRPLAPVTGVLLWGALALAWYLPLALALPALHNAYEWGYWLARLVIPALWGFALVLFATLDELLPAHRWLGGLVAAIVAAQALLHVLSLWY